jgi:membrane-associated phospholipid phosphatase
MAFSPRVPTLPLPTVRARASFAWMAFCVAAFTALATDLRLQGPVTRADIPISAWFHLHAQPAFTALASAVSHLHSTSGLLLMAFAAALALAYHRQTQWLPLLAMCVPGGLVLNWLVKHAFQRARPAFDPPAATLASYSFPSGHAAGATVWWGFVLLVWFAWERQPGRRAAACVIAITMILLTGLSRMALGLHYLSDVLAAMAEGAAWIVLCVAACQRLPSRLRQEGAP